ncbi:hypothetical protein [Microbulbifer sp. TYP-18]|uniref:hypothetical protein n=1 Tax=Microbulbifer sp. TYP-18 TaxID=3230024 RepID=UPI0034C68B39
MKCSNTHAHPEHIHGPDCGHTAIRHNDHVDYVYDGHLHHPHGDHCDEHVIQVSEKNPNTCSPVHDCDGHIHGPDCGHEAVPHEDHVDYIVNGRLHHVHDGHCDDHGPVEIVNS